MPTTLKDMMAQADAAAPRITAAEARAMIETGGALVVDVRDPAEVAASGKVPGAVNVPRAMLEFRADPDSPAHVEGFERSRPVIVYCASGGRSALAGRTLTEMGYETVRNLGGFKDWVAAGGEVERD
ncbi:MAG: rhodanese-like domain-containing protein [Pseudomonadota bacterium]|nr:rhodanese-like domain-containing protein [Pseudomonadota bacterium]